MIPGLGPAALLLASAAASAAADDELGTKPATPAAGLVLVDARLWDGTGAAVSEGAWLWVRDGSVAAVGDAGTPLPAGVQTLDLHGRTVLPGLIDAHVHLEAVPGAGLRQDPPDTLAAHRRAALPAYLACGVTTVLDTGISLDTLAQVRGWLDEGTPGPRLLTLGPVLGPKGGYVSAFLPQHPGADTADEIAAHLDRLVAADAVGLKLTIEPGYLHQIYPLHTPAQRREIAAAAAVHGLPIYVHAQRAEAWRQGLDISPHAFVHLPRDLDDSLPAEAAAAGVYAVTTLQLYGTPLRVRAGALDDDPLLTLVTPADLLEHARTKLTWRRYKRANADIAFPKMPGLLRSLGVAVYPMHGFFRRELARNQENLRQLQAAGVPLVLGSDAGAYDTIPYYFHGASSLTELELLVEAGLTPTDALLAATGTAARMLDLEGQIGSLVPGGAADLVIVDGDPLTDLRVLRDAWGVMRDGELRRPAEWMEGRAAR